jgi:hypothetical protein
VQAELGGWPAELEAQKLEKSAVEQLFVWCISIKKNIVDLDLMIADTENA